MVDRKNELLRSSSGIMIRLCAVSYLNTKPFLTGLMQSFTKDEITVQTAIPSECAEIFKQSGADIALVPVGVLPELASYELLPGYCIGAQGRVDSVFLCSHEPIEQLDTLIPDLHSRTSNLLAQVLLKSHWRHTVAVQSAVDGSWQKPESGKGYVIIGDKAVSAARGFRYVYDLAYEWQQYTGLPFVFAVWVHRNLGDKDQVRILKAFESGIQKLESVANEWGPVFGLSPGAALYYYQHAISFTFDEQKRLGMDRFLDEVRSLAVY